MDKQFLIIAHRGESFDAPENTLASINLAWERNDKAVEIDIQLTKDKKIIVAHDKNTYRLAGKFKNILSQTLNELKFLDVGSYKGEKWKGEKIPTLNEVLKTLPKNKYLFIEIKSDSEIIQFLKNIIDNSLIEPEFIKFISFNKDLIAKLKTVFPLHQCFWIYENKIFKRRKSIPEIINQCKETGLDGLDLRADTLNNETEAREIKQAGLDLYTWTVNDFNEAKKFYQWGFDGITSDKAKMLQDKFDAYKKLTTEKT